ncbi:hypothetical protein COB57_01780 [Candidatus Peregrinibacteria bacterium]|nr:MAG: hypothetical protein COB57_01780 [Candidatus Peregrinibacteria bacterium]
MYFKTTKGKILIQDNLDDKQKILDISMFQSISSIKYSSVSKNIFLTGVRINEKSFNIQKNLKGDYKLYKLNSQTLKWELIFNKYANDPVYMHKTGNIAFCYGPGLMVITPEGKIVKKINMGRFSWGPRSLSVSPNGDKLAIIKWEGDEKKIYIYNSNDDSFQRYSSTVYNYVWLDNDNIIFDNDNYIKKLSISDGKVAKYFKNYKDIITTTLSGENKSFSRFLDCKAHEIDVSIGSLKKSKDNLYFTLRLFLYGKSHRFNGVFCYNIKKHTYSLVYKSHKNSFVDGFACNDEGIMWINIRYQSEKRRDKKIFILNHKRLKEGWDFFPSDHLPYFSFQFFPKPEINEKREEKQEKLLTKIYRLFKSFIG